MSQLPRQTYLAIIELISEFSRTPNQRRALVLPAFYGYDVLDQVEWEGNARVFSVNLVDMLMHYGEVEEGKPALVLLLEEIYRQVGVDRRREIKQLLAKLAPKPVVQQATRKPKKKKPSAAVRTIQDSWLAIAHPDAATVRKKYHGPYELTVQGETLVSWVFVLTAEGSHNETRSLRSILKRYGDLHLTVLFPPERQVDLWDETTRQQFRWEAHPDLGDDLNDLQAFAHKLTRLSVDEVEGVYRLKQEDGD
jgi:hypothetical protein